MAKKLLSAFILVIGISWGVQAKDLFHYPVIGIAAELKENANSIVRKNEIALEIYSETKIIYRVEEVVTIMNGNGESAGVLFVPYDTNNSITIDEANIYDADGRLVKKFKQSEIIDQLYFDGFSLFNDLRFKKIDPAYNRYPYTVEYKYSLTFEGVLDYWDWSPCSYNQSIEHAGLWIFNHTPNVIRMKSNHIEPKMKGERAGGPETYYWKIENMPAMETEPYSVGLSEIAPNVKLAPSKFSYYGYAGNFDSWDSFGTWILQLLTERDQLPKERIAFFKNLVADKQTTFEKVKTLYEFLQNKTRYVSIQLGIGSFQPFPASVVDEVGYGDCKALSNYMKAMLSAVGIDAKYTLIRGGANSASIDPEFPAQGFNHAILTVPMEDDTLFLECTSPFAPCGYLSDFTSDRYALVVSEDGSKLVKTKKYHLEDNTWDLNAMISIDETGNASIVDTVKYRGLQYDYIEDELRENKTTQLENEFKRSSIAGAHYNDIEYISNKTLVPEATRMRQFDVQRYATVMNGRMFFPVNVLNKNSAVPKKMTERKNDFELSMSYQDNDHVEFVVPNGYEIEFLPNDISFESEFGSFSSTLEKKGNRIEYHRQCKRKEGVFDKTKYMDYVNFVKKIVDADAQRIVIKKS